MQFAYSAASRTRHVEVFCFGTRLARITDALRLRDPDHALNLAAEVAVDWEGGTRIGDSLREFVRPYGRQAYCRGAVVVMCSDGLERGDPALLADQMAGWLASPTGSFG